MEACAGCCAWPSSAAFRCTNLIALNSAIVASRTSTAPHLYRAWTCLVMDVCASATCRTLSFVPFRAIRLPFVSAADRVLLFIVARIFMTKQCKH